MSNENKALTLPLAIVTGVALGTNPNFQPMNILSGSPVCPTASCFGGEGPGAPLRAVMIPGRRGAESPELRALRLAEDALFPDLADDEPDLGPQTLLDPPVACDLPSRPTHPTHSLAVTTPEDFLRGLNLPSLPIQRHPRVKKYIQHFSKDSKGRAMFTAWLKRSGRYRDVIAKRLADRNLPRDLEAVVFIESGFWPTAVSSAGAAGLWQFMPKTARAYGLTVTKRYDERHSIWRATEAAAEHLGDLYTRFQSWDLALAAYNYGYQNVEKRIAAMGTDDFWTLSEFEDGLPRETDLYVPKVLAVAVLLNNLDAFGFNAIDIDPPLEAAEIEAPPGLPLSVLARAAGTSITKLREFNPELRGNTTPDLGAPVVLHIPSSGYARARVMLPRLLGDEQDRLDLMVSPDFDWGRDDLGKNGMNRLERTGRAEDPFGLGIRRPEQAPAEDASDAPGALVPDRLKATTAPEQGPLTLDSSSGKETPDPVGVHYRVSPGDTLSEIAGRFGISQGRLARDNALSDPSVVRIGQLLRLDVPKDRARLAKSVYYKVRENDTVDVIASRFGIDPGRIVSLNAIDDAYRLRAGRLLVLNED
jgi:membrane-bound lytic murein transglycosylase D